MAAFGDLETDVEPLAGLMRDHTETHALVTDVRETIEAALESPDNAPLAQSALEKLRDLDAYMADSLTIHIAKEEHVLFPALRGFAADIDVVVDEMVEQHDEVRLRQANIERALAAIDHSHDEVDAARAGVSATLRTANRDGATPDTLELLLDAVKRLDWILQGHFGDEEADLFEPALALLSPDAFAELAVQSADLEARSH